MKKKVIINPDGVAYLPGIDAIVSTGKQPFEEPPIPKIITLNAPYNYSPWGDDNLYPLNAKTDAYKSTIIPTVLEWKAKALYSGGMVYGTVSIDETTGEEKLTVVKDAEIDAWLKRSSYKRTLIKLCSDFYWYYNIFPALILSKDRTEIATIAPQESLYCRFQVQNPDNNNKIDNVFVNANWLNRGSIQNSLKIPVLDLNYDAVNALRNRNDSFIYVYPVAFPSPGESYYQIPAWDTLRQSGWLGVAQAIPMFKKSLMTNQLSIKYHIEVSEAWWKWKYPDWDSLAAQKKVDIRTEELQTFNDLMTGKNNAGKSIMSTFRVDPHTQKEYAGWRITAIDDKIKDGIYVEDSQEASSHHYSALGVDPTLLGNSPGKGMGAGSGSDKRVAFNIYVNNCRTEQDLILEPYQFVADYNGWSDRIPGLTFWFRNYWISTLETGKEMTSKTGGTNGVN